MPAKTAPKTAKSPRNGAEIPLGNHPGNTGGKPGRSGRRAASITLAAQRIFEKDKLLEVAAMIARAEIGEATHTKDGEVLYGETKNSDRLAAIRFLASYAYGNPKEQIEHSGEVELNVQDARRTFQSRMDSLTQRLGAATMPEWPER